jgi:hypothetical protein
MRTNHRPIPKRKAALASLSLNRPTPQSSEAYRSGITDVAAHARPLAQTRNDDNCSFIISDKGTNVLRTEAIERSVGSAAKSKASCNASVNTASICFQSIRMLLWQVAPDRSPSDRGHTLRSGLSRWPGAPPDLADRRRTFRPSVLCEGTLVEASLPAPVDLRKIRRQVGGRGAEVEHFGLMQVHLAVDFGICAQWEYLELV